MIMMRKVLVIIIMVLTMMMIEHSCGQSVEEACLRGVLMIIMRKKYFLLWLIVISFVNVLNSQPLSQLSPGLHDEILGNLHKLSFTRWHHQIFSSNKKQILIKLDVRQIFHKYLQQGGASPNIQNIHQANNWTNISQISPARAGGIAKYSKYSSS